MASLNKVMLIGNLTRDVEMRFTPSGAGIANFGIAVNRKFRDKSSNELREEVTFVDIEVWGKTAETAQKYLSKGRPVFIEGRLKLDQWDDKQTGQKRSRMKVVGETIQFLSSGGTGGPGGGGQGGGAPRAQAPRAPQRQAPQQPAGDPDFGDGPPPEDLDIQEENIPF